MSVFHDAHVVTGWFLIVSNAVVGAWAVVAQYVPALRHRVLWWATGVAQVSALVVAVFGALVVNRDGVELDSFHALYGFSTIFAVAILYSYRNSPFISDKLHLLYGLGGLFIMGLGIRALFLDGVAHDPTGAATTMFSALVG